MDDSFDLHNDSQLDSAQVIGVHQLESIFTCISCSQKDVNDNWDLKCQQCTTVQKQRRKADLQVVP